MKKLYVFGNEYLKDDYFAKKVSKLINNFIIVPINSPDELLDIEDEEIVILDVVKNIKEPTFITDISQLKTRNIISLHDFDLAFFLKLMKEMGIRKKIKIIGIPQNGDVIKTAEEVKSCIKKKVCC